MFPKVRRCRACLAAIEFREGRYVDVLEQFGDEDVTILQVFNECTGLNIDPADLEKEQLNGKDVECRYLCLECKEDLKCYFNLAARARCSDKALCKAPSEEMVRSCEVPSDEMIEDANRLPTSSQCDMSPFEMVEVDTDDIFSVENENTEYTSDSSKEQWHSEPWVDEAIPRIVAPDSPPLWPVDDNFVALESELKRSNETLPAEYLESDKDEEQEYLQIERLNENKPSDKSLTIKVEAEALKAKTRPTFEFKCEVCPDSFKYQRNLNAHYDEEHAELPANIRCGLCTYSTVTKSALRLHMHEFHESRETVDCSQCGRSVLRDKYELHLKKHQKVQQFLCNECPKIFASAYTLNKHLDTHSVNRTRSFDCAECGRKFYTQEAMKEHQETHLEPSNRAVHTCIICGKSFVRSSNLRLHLQIHRGETIDCVHCGKEFVRRKDLEIHIRFHTKDFPYACEKCGKRFAIKGHLRSHEKRHLGVRYKCSRCDKVFLNMSGLKQHSYEHIGMPYECTVCQKGFPTPFKVRRHLRSMHDALFDAGYSDEAADIHILKTKPPKTEVQRHYVVRENLDAGELSDTIIEESEVVF